MIQTHYVSFEEFAQFKHMIEEKLEEQEKRSIETDEKIDNLTDLMMDGFDMLRDKIEAL